MSNDSANAFVSVIVPVYKVEGTIEAAVKSIQAQTYNNLEIILVDDGSPDKSGEICDRLALEDNRIKVIHKQNGGVSSARNEGISQATSEYLCFVDSDDEIESTLIEKLVTEQRVTGAQLVTAGFLEYHKKEIKKNVEAHCRIDFSVTSSDPIIDICSKKNNGIFNSKTIYKKNIY